MSDMPPVMTSPTAVRFSAGEFLQMDGAGVFDRHAKTELIRGEVLSMNAQHRRHSRIKNALAERIRDVLSRISSDLTALSEVSVVLPPDNVPEPDVVVFVDDGGDGPVAGENVRLVIEVADTTLALDLGVKAVIYANAGIAEYWVIDVEAQRIVRHETPTADSYADTSMVPFGDPITAATIAGLTIATDGL